MACVYIYNQWKAEIVFLSFYGLLCVYLLVMEVNGSFCIDARGRVLETAFKNEMDVVCHPKNY